MIGPGGAGRRRQSFRSHENTGSVLRRAFTPQVVVLLFCLIISAMSLFYLFKVSQTWEFEDPLPAHHAHHHAHRHRVDKLVDRMDREVEAEFRRVEGDQRFVLDQGLHTSSHLERPKVLVSYAYYEVDHTHKANFEYFLIVGMGLDSVLSPPEGVEFAVVVNGRECEPCAALLPGVEGVPAPESALYDQVKATDFLTLLFRFEDNATPMAAHNFTLSWAASAGRLQRYSYFMFLDSSARGPFYPQYLPASWQWSDAFVAPMMAPQPGQDRIAAVGAALTCLPGGQHTGGRGPRLEPWAFAVSSEGLAAATAGGGFALRDCLGCEEVEPALGEYGASAALLARGLNFMTLLSKYGRSVDWRSEQHWGCNDLVTPSRHGSYDGVDMHPFESLFVKSVWHVGEPFTSRYSRWMLQRALGRQTTQGTLQEAKYKYFASEKSEGGSDMGACYPWLRRKP